MQPGHHIAYISPLLALRWSQGYILLNRAELGRGPPNPKLRFMVGDKTTQKTR